MKKSLSLFLGTAACFLLLSSTIDVSNLFNYANQTIPNYVNRDNTPDNNPITNEGATLGRVLFYDKNLSANNSIACASCHQQEFAFSDTAVVSVGLSGGTTGRHSMRLVNARFAEEERFFWDERATSLEDQTTQPIQDHVEMGFSGDNGDPNLDSLIRRLSNIHYYQQLFTLAFGDKTITESRMQLALAQFIRSIQSFDSKYDAGRAQVNNNNDNFPNFTEQENHGKQLYMTNQDQDGAGCNRCHRAPIFDIRDNSRNNGVITVASDPNATDINNTRSPSLRDIFNVNDQLNGPLMHDGSFNSLLDVINHYNEIPNGPNLDNRLGGGPNGNGQNLNLTQTEKDALVAFLKTLTGSNIYTDEKWSNPFDTDGNLTVLNGICATSSSLTNKVSTGSFNLSVDSSILSNSQIANATVTYKAGNAIILSAGFQVGTNSSFSAFIENCVSNTLNMETVQRAQAEKPFQNELMPQKEQVSISIAPNPAQNFLKITIPNFNESQRGQLFLVDLSGRIVRETKIFSHHQTMNLSDIKTGMYILKIIVGQQQYLKKIVIKD